MHASALLREHVSPGGAHVRGSLHSMSARAELCWVGVPGCLFASLTAVRWLLGRLRQCARFLLASSTRLGTSQPSPGSSRAAPPPAWEASPRPRPQCFNPYKPCSSAHTCPLKYVSHTGITCKQEMCVHKCLSCYRYYLDTQVIYYDSAHSGSLEFVGFCHSATET